MKCIYQVFGYVNPSFLLKAIISCLFDRFVLCNSVQSLATSTQKYRVAFSSRIAVLVRRLSEQLSCFLLGKRLWSFPSFHSDCAAGYWRFLSGTILEQKEHLTGICNQMMLQLHDIYDPDSVCNQMLMLSTFPTSFVGLGHLVTIFTKLL